MLRLEDFVMEFLEAGERVSTVYEPRDDSFLLLEALAEVSLEGMKVLDMGTGSGILAAYSALRGAEVTASDIDSKAIRALGTLSQRLGVRLKLVVCDLFAEINDQFDLVVFNPPYLPSGGVDDPTVDGGDHGTRVVKRFLDELSGHVTEIGYGMFLASSLNRPDDLRPRYPDMDLEVIRQRQLFFETLYVIRAKARKTRT
jgi:release factor glutamine methyltransferase